MPKYISKKDGKILHCPSCRGVILRHFDFGSDKKAGKGGFKMRCPHCQRDIKIEVRSEDEIVIKEAE